MIELNDPGAVQAPSGRRLGAAHLLVGQTPGELVLFGARGQPWPQTGLTAGYAPIRALRIPVRTETVASGSGRRLVKARRPTVLRPALVGTHPALVLRSAPYPLGDIHSGHILVVWNAAGDGHLLSLHYDGAPLRSRIRAAIAAAASVTRVPVTPAPPGHR